MSNIIKFPGNKNQYDELNSRIQKLRNHIDNLVAEMHATRKTLVEIELQLNKLKIQSKFKLIKLNKNQDNQ